MQQQHAAPPLQVIQLLRGQNLELKKKLQPGKRASCKTCQIKASESGEELTVLAPAREGRSMQSPLARRPPRVELD